MTVHVESLSGYDRTALVIDGVMAARSCFRVVKRFFFVEGVGSVSGFCSFGVVLHYYTIIVDGRTRTFVVPVTESCTRRGRRRGFIARGLVTTWNIICLQRA